MKSLISLMALFVLAGCGSTEAPRPGSESVYQRIESLSDCEALQAEFDTANNNGNTHYMEAADKRMQEVGCY